MARGRHAGALQFYGMGRTEPEDCQGRNSQGHGKILKNTFGQAGKIG